MKTVKMSLENMMGKMSRKEMKTIMAGSGGGGCTNYYCCSELPCCDPAAVCSNATSSGT